MRRLLSFSPIYLLWARLVGGRRSKAKWISDHLKPVEHERVLDLGCGPAEILSYLGDVKYVGLDIHKPYIHAAKNRYGTRGDFHCEPAGRLRAEWERSFDLVMSIALLHHLTDEEVHKPIQASRIRNEARRAARHS